MARRISETVDQTRRVLEIFKRFDTNGDGSIDRDELCTVLRRLCPLEMKDCEIDKLMCAADTNGDGQIDYLEFCAWLFGADESSTVARNVARSSFGGSQWVRIKQLDLADFYTLEGLKLGEGGFGTVKRAKNRSTKRQRAVKTVPKDRVSRETLDAEISAMKTMDHPNILQLYEVYEDVHCLHLVMELCTGGELLEFILENESVTERQVACIMRQILGGVRYMHGRRVCHRDIKPDNFLLASKGAIEDTVLKIIDFGAACTFVPGQKVVASSSIGTIEYTSPEQIGKDGYDEKCDVWACGVTLFMLFTGNFPFSGATDEDTSEKVEVGTYDLAPDLWDQVSAEPKSLLAGLLAYEPSDRLSADQAFGHGWVANTRAASEDRISAAAWQNMKAFCGASHLKKAAIKLIAQRLSNSQLKHLQQTFMALDADGDGLLTYEELKVGLERMELQDMPASILQVLEDIDSSWTGGIDYTEFLASAMDKRQYCQQGVCRAAFQAFDQNGDGHIDRSELAQLFHNSEVEAWMSSSTIQQILAECDLDNDSRISFEEFMCMMKGK